MLDDAVPRRHAKKRATSRRLTLSRFTARALRDALAERPATSGRIVLPTAGHGLPAYDHMVAELRALEAEDDLA